MQPAIDRYLGADDRVAADVRGALDQKPNRSSVWLEATNRRRRQAAIRGRA